MGMLGNFPKPEVVVPDTSPLIHLAAAGVLDILTAVGEVVLVDMVVYEATERQDKPYAKEVAAWVRRGMEPGSNTPMRVVSTLIGEMYQKARLADPTYRARGAGEMAILLWLAEEVETTKQNVLVVYENGKVPDLIRRNAMDANVAVLTTRAFLNYAERQGLIEDAAAIWQKVIDHVPTASRADVELVIHRPGDEP
jgi:predicted nucleic acid-binding protein